MKVFNVIVKIAVALAAIAGAVYVAATYGDKIVAWCKKMVGKCSCKVCTCTCDEDCDDCPCEEDCENCPCDAVAEEAPAEEPAPEEAPAEEAPAEEVPTGNDAPVANEADFEG